MIVGIPDSDELNETAIGWLNLAWEITIITLKDFYETKDLYETESALDEQESTKYQNEYWYAQRYRLNNAITLLQQSMELFLKARIAAISPFLLVVNDPQSWPRAEPNGEIEFSHFRTLDATHLCKITNVVCDKPLPKDFPEFFDRIRKERNKIVHLNAGNMQVEAGNVLLEVLTAFDFLFPTTNWVDFRRRYMVSTREYAGPSIYDADRTHSSLMPEISAAFETLEPRYIRKFFGFDPRRKALNCPNCLYLRSKWDDTEPAFAQKQRDGTIRCAACSTVFTEEQYSQQIAEWE